MWFKNECNRTSERLWEYASQRLSASETTQIETHLQQCSRCQTEAEAYRQTVGMLGAVRQMPVPASQTTWRDLRPSLAPNRRPLLRSADLLPRLTLAGAGAALGATLLIVFFTGGHHGTAISSSTNPSPTSQPSAESPSTSDVAMENSKQDEPDKVPSGASMSAFLNITSSFLNMPGAAPVAQPNAASTLKTSTVHRRSPHFIRVASNPRSFKSVATTADWGALDGSNVTPRSPQDYVINTVSSSSDEDPPRYYVLPSISGSQNGSIASSEGADEGSAW